MVVPCQLSSCHSTVVETLESCCPPQTSQCHSTVRIWTQGRVSPLLATVLPAFSSSQTRRPLLELEFCDFECLRTDYFSGLGEELGLSTVETRPSYLYWWPTPTSSRKHVQVWGFLSTLCPGWAPATENDNDRDPTWLPASPLPFPRPLPTWGLDPFLKVSTPDDWKEPWSLKPSSLMVRGLGSGVP